MSQIIKKIKNSCIKMFENIYDDFAVFMGRRHEKNKHKDKRRALSRILTSGSCTVLEISAQVSHQPAELGIAEIIGQLRPLEEEWDISLFEIYHIFISSCRATALDFFLTNTFYHRFRRL